MPARLYPAELTAAAEGGFVVRFPDIPEAITQAESVEDALTEAADALEEALIRRLTAGEKIPFRTRQRPGNTWFLWLRKPRG